MTLRESNIFYHVNLCVRSVSFDYFPLEVPNPDYNVLNILEEIAPETQVWQVQKELSKLAVDEDVLYRQYAFELSQNKRLEGEIIEGCHSGKVCPIKKGKGKTQ